MSRVELFAAQIATKITNGDQPSDFDIGRFEGLASRDLSRIFPEEKFSEEEMVSIIELACRDLTAGRINRGWKMAIFNIVRFGVYFNIPLFVEILLEKYANCERKINAINIFYRISMEFVETYEQSLHDIDDDEREFVYESDQDDKFEVLSDESDED